MIGTNIDWMVTTPATDCNFKSALERSTYAEICEAISQLEGKKGTKTKIAALERELRKRVRI